VIRALAVVVAVGALAATANAGLLSSPLGSHRSSLAASAASADARKEFILQFRGTVTVEDDGNGVLSAHFPTTVSGPNVHYVVVTQNGCDTGQTCSRSAVGGLTVTLNNAAFEDGDELFETVFDVDLNDVGAADNNIVVAARGAPGSSARVRVLAVRDPGNCTPCCGSAQTAPTAQMNMQF